MYGKEIKFYKDIAPFININCPKCFHIVNNEKSKGVLLAYLSEKEGEFNSNLNTDITTVVTVIKELIKIHTRFVFKTNDRVINSMKSLCKINEIDYYFTLVDERYNKFKNNIKKMTDDNTLKIFDEIKKNYKQIGDYLSTFY